MIIIAEMKLTQTTINQLVIKKILKYNLSNELQLTISDRNKVMQILKIKKTDYYFTKIIRYKEQFGCPP